MTTLTAAQHEALTLIIEAEASGEGLARSSEKTEKRVSPMITSYHITEEMIAELVELGYAQTHSTFWVQSTIAGRKATTTPITPEAAPVKAAKAVKPVTRKPAYNYLSKLESMDTPTILKELKIAGYSHLIQPADYGEIHGWALEILLREKFGVEAANKYRAEKNARYQVQPPFPVEQSTPAKVNAIVYRRLDPIQIKHSWRIAGCHHHVLGGANIGNCMYCGQWIDYPDTDLLIVRETYRQNWLGVTPTAKPASTVSPALIVSTENAIALAELPAIRAQAPAPMELPTRFVVAGNKHLRVTSHHAAHGATYTLETLESFSGTWEPEPHGYANCEQLDNAIARIARESTPAPVATEKPADVEETYRAHTLFTHAYSDTHGGYLWRLKIRGPLCGGLVMSGYFSSEKALAMGRVYVNDKYSHQRKGGGGL